ncbi:MAG: thioredoxin [Candidatus Thermoplasmatota archaeon]
MDNDKEVEEIKKKMVEDIMNKKEEENYPKEPIKVNDNDFQETIDNYPLVLVDFWAEWCGPCKMMEPVLEELAEEYQGEVVIAKMNVDNNQKVPNNFGVSSIPTLVLFKNGERVDRMIGALQKQQLEQKFEEHLN